MKFMPASKDYVDENLAPIRAKLVFLDAHQQECMTSHELIRKSQERTDIDTAGINATLQATLATNKEILDTIKEYLPTLERTQAAYTTQDTVKAAAIWIAAFAAGGAGLHYIVRLFL